MSDPNWDDVVLRCTFDTDFSDVSQSGHTLTGIGTAPSISASNAKFSSNLYGTTNYGYGLEAAHSTDFEFADGDFTVEFWWRYEDSQIYNHDMIALYERSTNMRSWAVGSASGRQMYTFGSSNGSSADLWNVGTVLASAIPLDTWVHIALERAGTVVRLYVDGVMEEKFTVGTSSLYAAASASLRINADITIDGANAARSWRMDDLRITKGLARYNSDSGYTPPTAALPTAGAATTAEGTLGGPATLVPPEGEVVLVTVAEGSLGTLTLSAPGASFPVIAEGDIGTVNLSAPAKGYTNVTQFGSLVAALGSGVSRVSSFFLSALGGTEANIRVTQMGLLVLAEGSDAPIVPDPLSLSDSGRDPLLIQRNVNMYVEPTPQGPARNARYPRPGLYEVATRGGGPIRATFLHKGFRYTVSGTSVWRDAVNIGTVPADGDLRWAISDEEIVIIAGQRAYYVTLDDVTRITDPDLPFVRDVIFLAGRFVYFDADSSGIYRYSFVNDAKKIDGLAFASAESNPDAIIGAAIQGEGMAIFGEKTTEWHYPTTDPDNPFQRSPGRTYDKGCLSIQTARMADNALHFVGSDRIIYRAGTVPTRVSTHHEEDKLRRLSEEEFEACSAFTVVFGGHTFYVVNMPGQGTHALNVGQNRWAEWRSWGRNRFRVAVCEDGFMGDAFSGKIMGFDAGLHTDLGEPLERIVSTFAPLKSGYLRNFNLALHCAQGVGLLPGQYGEDPVVEMRYSDHLGRDFSPWLEAPLGRRSVRTKESLAQWTSLGTFASPGRVFEFRCTDPVFFAPYTVSFNEPRP